MALQGSGGEGATSVEGGRRGGGDCLFVLALNDLGGLAGAKRAQIPKATRKQSREGGAIDFLRVLTPRPWASEGASARAHAHKGGRRPSLAFALARGL
jgi:hypothetical protein